MRTVVSDIIIGISIATLAIVVWRLWLEVRDMLDELDPARKGAAERLRRKHLNGKKS